MLFQKKWSFGLGTIFSLIVVYFIFLYSSDKGWAVLSFVAKWYLIIIGGLIALTLGIILLVILASLLIILITLFKLRSSRKGHKAQKHRQYIDAEYKVKE